MIYKTIAILENNERAFVQDLLLNINNEIQNVQKISSEKITGFMYRTQKVGQYKLGY